MIQSFKNTYFAPQMKLFHKPILSLTLLATLWLPYGCQQKSKKDNSSVMKAYSEARKAQDYTAASALLLQIAANDSAGSAWVYDSLSLYHFIYLAPTNMVRNPTTAKYYTEKGLKYNANNDFLQEIKAKLLLEEQNDTASFKIFKSLYDKSGDYTYLWEMTLVELLRRRTGIVDTMVMNVLTSSEADNKTVRIMDQVRQTVKAKAAFLYIKATLYNMKGELKGTAESLQEALKIEPNFFLAQKGLYELQQNLSGAGSQNR